MASPPPPPPKIPKRERVKRFAKNTFHSVFPRSRGTTSPAPTSSSQHSLAETRSADNLNEAPGLELEANRLAGATLSTSHSTSQQSSLPTAADSTSQDSSLRPGPKSTAPE